jgi:hypothetical protein
MEAERAKRAQDAFDKGTLKAKRKVGRANVAHMRQSKPDSGLCFQVKNLESLNRFLLRSVAGQRASGRSIFIFFITLTCTS